VPAHVGGREPLHVLARPGDLLPQAVRREHQRARAVVQVHVAPALIQILGELLQDDLALELDLRQARRAQQLAQDLHPARDRLRLERDLVERVVASGLGVQRAAQLLDGEIQLVRAGQSLGPAEQHVLEEMGQPVVGRGLVARAHLGVHHQRGAMQMRELHGHDPKAVLQHILLDDTLRQHGGRA
jgi:hypothetical protein